MCFLNCICVCACAVYLFYSFYKEINHKININDTKLNLVWSTSEEILTNLKNKNVYWLFSSDSLLLHIVLQQVTDPA